VLIPVVDTPKFNHSDQIDAFVPFLITEGERQGKPQVCQGHGINVRASGLGFARRGQSGSPGAPQVGAIRGRVSSGRVGPFVEGNLKIFCDDVFF